MSHMEEKALAVSVRGLSFGWGRKPVLKSLDLDVEAGEVMAVVGANGAGKSTLLTLLSGSEPYRRRFWPPRRGTKVEVLGMDPVRSGHGVRSAVGYVHDHLELPPWMRVRDHVALVRALYADWDQGACDGWLGKFDVDPGTPYGDLSKGQRMLENLAVVLARKPQLMLLDEPFSGLDPVARRLVTEGIIESLCEDERSVILVSHSVTDVARCADRVALFGDGRVQEVATVDELRSRSSTGDLEDSIFETAMEGRAA